MNYYEMIPIDQHTELTQALVEGKTCKLTPEQNQKVIDQIGELSKGDEIFISPRGLVILRDRGQEVYIMGRIDADSNFYRK